MVDALRELPVSFFAFVNPAFWLFVLHPALVFWFRRDHTTSDGLSLSALMSLGVGWFLWCGWVFGTDRLVWVVADLRDPIPKAWERYLFEDGARDVFALYFGWAFAAAALLAWAPLLLGFEVLRRRRRRAPPTLGSHAA